MYASYEDKHVGAVEDSKYVISIHASQRMGQRGITVEDVLSELGNIDIRDYQVVTDLKWEWMYP